MKNLLLLSALSLSMLLVACGANKPVGIASGTDSTTVLPRAIADETIISIPANVPPNATALCRDGTYSMAKENLCLGNGGVTTLINRYHSE